MEDSPKHILILSYFFPPCELTASRRTESWAKEWSALGHKVTVVTRKWERPIKSFTDMHYSTSSGTEILDKEGYKVHAVSYIANRRDQLLTENKSKLYRKFLSIKELMLQPIHLDACPFSNMYSEAKKVCQNEKVDVIVVSGNPFIQFKFGYLLNKEFGIPLIIDYRDAWTTSEINRIDKGKMYGLFEKYERPFEKKWVRSASLITASSSSIGKSVEEITGIKSAPIYNGFDEALFKGLDNIEKYPEFTITYVGTLYQGQHIEIFIDGFKDFIQNTGTKPKLLFPGLALNKEQHERIKTILQGFEDYYEVTERIPHEEILKIEKRSHLLLHVAWKGYKGIIASKIYEYMGSGTPVLICPGDDGDIDEIVNSSASGTICNSREEVAEFLKRAFHARSDSEKTNPKLSVAQFTRQTQARILAKEIQSLS